MYTMQNANGAPTEHLATKLRIKFNENGTLKEINFEGDEEFKWLIKEVIDKSKKGENSGQASAHVDKTLDMEPPPKVFISYAREDLKFAEKAASIFSDHGFNVWFDKISLKVGDHWEDEIEKAMDDSDFVVILLSKNSVTKKGIFPKEVRMALDRQKETPLEPSGAYVLPIIIDDICIPRKIQSLQCPNISNDIEGGLQGLVDDINIHYQKKIKI